MDRTQIDSKLKEVIEEVMPEIEILTFKRQLLRNMA